MEGGSGVDFYKPKSVEIFILKYVFQATIHCLWMGRNGKRHGEASKSQNVLIRSIDKGVRNRFQSITRVGDNRMEDGLGCWFSLRP